MLKNQIRALALAGAVLVPNVLQAQFANSVVSYNSGTGFAAGFTNASAAIGAPALGTSVTPLAPPFAKTQIVSIGAGGQITLQFNTPILNDPTAPYGNSFLLFANSFFISSGGNVSGLSSHPISAVVQVSQDDSTWFTLNPALAPEPGQLFPTDGTGNPQTPVNPSLTLNNFTGKNLAGIRSLYDGSAGGTGYDLSWAEDSGGNSVDLPDADFVRIEVQSGVLDLDAVSETQSVPETMSTVWPLAIVCAGLFWSSRRSRLHDFRQNVRTGKLDDGRGFSLSPRERAGVRGKGAHELSGVAAKIPAAFSLLALLGLLSSANLRAETITENFTNDPAADGWQVFGDTNLFIWDSTNHDLAVTWDSSQPNSYFYHPLAIDLREQDGFTLSFDWVLNDVTNANGTFQVALGFLNLSNAVSPDFLRGSGENTTNLVEFDYFFDPEFGDSPAVSENDTQGFFAAVDDLDPPQVETNTVYHISITHAPGDVLTSAEMTTDQGIFSSFPATFIETGFGDFRVNVISIISYSDKDAFGGATLLAHGTIANLNVTTTPRPVGNMTGQSIGSVWQAQFNSRTNWSYTLERATDLGAWSPVSPKTPGTDVIMTLQDNNPPTTRAFYRIHASQP